MAESCLPSFAFPGKCLPPHSRSSCRELNHQTLLSALRVCPKPASWSSWLCMPRTFPSMTTKLLLPERPRSTTAPALSYTGASVYMLPSSTIPTLSSSRKLSSVPSSSSLDLRMQLPYLFPALHSTGMSIHNAFLLFGEMQLLQPCFINTPVSS